MNTEIGLNRRRLKVRGESSGVYHCMGRVAGGQRLLGVKEREVLRKRMWRLAEFCGVEVLTYCILSNHFHVLVRVPPESETRGLSDAELARRVNALYPKERARVWIGGLEGEDREQTRERLLGRMGDVSEFMGELKHGFSVWYNRTHGRFGTLWAERFKSVLVEGTGRALLAVAGYIDLNPVRAGICEDPKDYRWCGYAEASGGSEAARGGLLRVLEGKDWRGAGREYRLILFGLGHHTQAGGAGGISREGFEAVKRAGGEMGLAQLLRCRVRYFSAGAVIGTKLYVEGVIKGNADYFGSGRKSGASRMRAGAVKDLYSARDLHFNVFG